jgi:RHS repeat-associated protein
MFDQARVFDAGGNVGTINTTLSAGTDNQAFCYDEQNRLTAAASSGTVPCQSFSAGTLAVASYNQVFAYDTMGRLTAGPLGAYAYGNSAHVHAATAIGSAYTATYDAAGNMTCRAPSSATTCAGTQTGAQLGYSNEGQMSAWQNQPTSPTSTAAFLYDGQGNRVAQQTVAGGVTTTTAYIGNVEEDATTGGVTNKTTYYYANGQRFAMALNGVISYLVTDGLGSANVSLDANGNVNASALYAPYGTQRYSSSTMQTSYGFTGQRLDAATGLNYYGSRYYDAVAGQFTSVDGVLPGGGYDIWGLSGYAYVEGNPVIKTDPNGQDWVIGGPGEPDFSLVRNLFGPRVPGVNEYGLPGPWGQLRLPGIGAGKNPSGFGWRGYGYTGDLSSPPETPAGAAGDQLELPLPPEQLNLPLGQEGAEWGTGRQMGLDPHSTGKGDATTDAEIEQAIKEGNAKGAPKKEPPGNKASAVKGIATRTTWVKPAGNISSRTTWDRNAAPQPAAPASQPDGSLCACGGYLLPWGDYSSNDWGPVPARAPVRIPEEIPWGFAF